MGSYPGGKEGAGVFQTIINNIPPHDTFIEPFVGGGAVFRNIRRAESSIVIDSDASAIAQFQKTPSITAIHGDGIKFFHLYNFTGREFIYADPPYVMGTRKSQRPIYKQEWDDGDHHAFLRQAVRFPCSIAISGYASELYEKYLGDWRCITYTAQTRRGPATEYLWMNYPEPTALHDYRYLGQGFRERERIKRKATRWTNNLSNMPPLERQAVLSAMLGAPRSGIAGNGDRIREPSMDLAIYESVTAVSGEAEGRKAYSLHQATHPAEKKHPLISTLKQGVVSNG